jgi:hypothetical protein
MTETFNINNSLESSYPWILAKIIEGVDLNSVYNAGYSEVPVDNKFQGKYMSICQVLSEPETKERLNAYQHDYVCVWATSIEQFELADYGSVVLIRNPDIFLRIVPGSELYKKIQAKLEAT